MRPDTVAEDQNVPLPPNDPFFRDDQPDDPRYEPPSFKSGIPNDICNLIMKGGVTSGVVFPGTVRLLATEYRFRRLGGTSAGAIAASLTAAAEFHRRANKENSAFNMLWQISESLGEVKKGETQLEALFAPNASTRSLHRLITSLVPSRRRTGHIPTRVLRSLMRSQPVALTGTLVGAALSSFGLLGYLNAQGSPSRQLGIALFGHWLTILGAGTLAYRLTAGSIKVLEENYLGLSTGLNPQDATKFDSFTPWLHKHLQTVSGLGMQHAPLTFGDLAPELFRQLHPTTPEARRAAYGELNPLDHLSYQKSLKDDIELRLVTTNLSAGRPVGLPLDGSTRDGKAYYFREEEWERYFPQDVMQHLKLHSERQVNEGLGSPTSYVYYRLPPPAEMPVVVATRMSMSFPVLFSVIPLYAIEWYDEGQRPPPPESAKSGFSHHTRKGGREGKFTCHPVVFGDGGLTSNFPLSLFDELVPTEPTFAINLEYGDGPLNGAPGGPQSLKMPRKFAHLNRPGFLRPYGQPEPVGFPAWEPRLRTSSAPGRNHKLVDYAMDIIESARNWSDNAMIPLPGYSERIAHVVINPGLGGTNLKMTDNEIKILRHRGARAGQLLIDRFKIKGNSVPKGFWDWEVHQAATFLTLTADIERLLQDYHLVYFNKGKLSVPGLNRLPFPRSRLALSHFRSVIGIYSNALFSSPKNQGNHLSQIFLWSASKSLVPVSMKEVPISSELNQLPRFPPDPKLAAGTWNSSGALRLAVAGSFSTTVRGYRRLRGKRAVLRYRSSG